MFCSLGWFLLLQCFLEFNILLLLLEGVSVLEAKLIAIAMKNWTDNCLDLPLTSGYLWSLGFISDLPLHQLLLLRLSFHFLNLGAQICARRCGRRLEEVNDIWLLWLISIKYKVTWMTLKTHHIRFLFLVRVEQCILVRNQFLGLQIFRIPS